jgi:N-acylneuraminate cytidylyltransferase
VVKDAIAVIPARGGSRRIPMKNIVEFCGKPMLQWTLEAARDCGLFARIVVSTDSEEIANVARSAGIEVPFLRDRHADDMAPVSKATLAALDQCRRYYGEDYRHVVQLMPNCPLRRAPHIEEAYRHYLSQGCQPQISCFRFGWMNPWWAATLDHQGHPKPLFPDAGKQRSQDLPALYCPSGAIWIASADALGLAGTFYADNHVFFPMDWRAAIDIDDEHDLDMARRLCDPAR